MFKNVDKKFESIGFRKINDDAYGASYIRESYEFDFVQEIDIIRKRSGKHIIMSYESGINKDRLNNTVGLTYDEIKLCMKKYRQLKRKYKWR